MMQTKEHLERISFEMMEDMHKDGVCYVETRFAPVFHTSMGLNYDEIILAVLNGLEKGKEKLEKMLASLKPREREILSLRFGLEDGTEWTLASIGEKLNVSRERARQLQNRALENLRKENLVALRDYIAV